MEGQPPPARDRSSVCPCGEWNRRRLHRPAISPNSACRCNRDGKSTSLVVREWNRLAAVAKAPECVARFGVSTAHGMELSQDEIPSLLLYHPNRVSTSQ